MAILNETEMLERLAHEDNYCRGSGRTPGAKNLPDKIRELAGFNAHFEKAKVVGAAFGIAPITAHMAKKSEGHPEVQTAIKDRLSEVEERALSILTSTLKNVTPERLAKLNVTNSMRTAEKAAKIIDSIRPKTAVTEGSKILIYAPQVNAEKDYEVLEIAATAAEA